MILTGGKARVLHLLYPLLDMRNVSVCSWLCIRTLRRPHAPKSTLEAKMDKNSVFVRVLGTRMVRNDRKARQEHRLYAEK